MTMYILFDIGATKMRVAASFDGRSFDRRYVKIAATPKHFKDGIALLRLLARELSEHAPRAALRKVIGVAGGVAGSLDAKKETIFHAPNMSKWDNRPLKKELQKAFRTKNVFLENDTALVGLGEAVRGAGRGKQIVAYITVSTGINGVRIVNGEIDRSALGFEIGHQILDKNTAHTMEYFAGAAALKKRYGMPAEKIHNPAVWKMAIKYLAIGIHNIILHWSPHVVVLGGGTIQSGNINAAHVEKSVNKILTIFPKSPPIKKASLGDLGGLYGALAFLHQQKKI